MGLWTVLGRGGNGAVVDVKVAQLYATCCGQSCPLAQVKMVKSDCQVCGGPGIGLFPSRYPRTATVSFDSGDRGHPPSTSIRYIWSIRGDFSRIKLRMDSISTRYPSVLGEIRHEVETHALLLAVRALPGWRQARLVIDRVGLGLGIMTNMTANHSLMGKRKPRARHTPRMHEEANHETCNAILQIHQRSTGTDGRWGLARCSAHPTPAPAPPRLESPTLGTATRPRRHLARLALHHFVPTSPRRI